MASYCSSADVGSRLGLNSAQRTHAASRLTTGIRRSSIDIDQTFRDYGRDVPSKSIADSTTTSTLSAGATSIPVADSSGFSTTGNGNVDGDSFVWTGNSANTLTGVTGLSHDHASGVTVQEGEMAHVLREICADLAAAYYMEDEGTFQNTGGAERGSTLRERGAFNIKRLAHLGSVD